MIRPAVFLAALTALFMGHAPVAAQNLFAPRLIVNDRAITNFEVEQRTQMLRLFRAPGDLDEEAVKALVEDRLRMAAAKDLNIKATPDQIKAGMEEFAGRANLNAEQFLTALQQAGVSGQTFRDFVEAGLVWREVIRRKFGPKANITEAEIDRAIAASNTNTALRVLISELVIPAPPGQEGRVMALARQLKSQIKTEGGFASAARRYSATATAGRGGRLDWMPISNLPPAIAPLVLGLAPGEVSDPVEMGGAVGLFQLRGIEEIQGAAPKSVSVDYAQYLLPSGKGAAENAAKLRSKVDTCNDLYGLAKGQPEDRLVRKTQNLGEVPTNIAMELAKLDPNESIDYASGGAHVLLMLCKREPVLDVPPSRDDIRSQLVNLRLGSLAQSYLEELRANAIIREP